MQTVRPRRIRRRDVTVCKMLGKTEVGNLAGLRNNFTSVHTHTHTEDSEEGRLRGRRIRRTEEAALCAHRSSSSHALRCRTLRFALSLPTAGSKSKESEGKVGATRITQKQTEGHRRGSRTHKHKGTHRGRAEGREGE